MNKAQPGSNTVVLGASTNEARYSFKALKMLQEYGFKPIPVHPSGHVVDGITCLKSLNDVKEEIDTLTVYVNSKISDNEYDNIVQLNPRRVIFNPGADNWPLGNKLKEKGIEVIHSCTLVMLRTKQF